MVKPIDGVSAPGGRPTCLSVSGPDIKKGPRKGKNTDKWRVGEKDSTKFLVQCLIIRGLSVTNPRSFPADGGGGNGKEKLKNK